MNEIEVLAPSPEAAKEKISREEGIDQEFLEVIEEYEPDEIDLKEYVEENKLEAAPSKDEISLYVVSVAFSYYVKKAQEWTQGLIERFAPGATAEAIRFRHLIIIRLNVPESSILIGKQGATLDALQHVVVRALLTHDESFPDIMLDVERYREKKLIRLEKEAKRAADKALRSGRKIPLTPMSPAERKFIHNTIKDIEGVRTESRGKDRARHIVVESTNPRPRHGGGGGHDRQHGGQHGGGGRGGRSMPGRPNKKQPQGPLTEEQRQMLYGRMKEQYRETELETNKQLLPKYVPQEPVTREDDKLTDEIE
jgi:predicted RNA-binding protein Jag